MGATPTVITETGTFKSLSVPAVHMIAKETEIKGSMPRFMDAKVRDKTKKMRIYPTTVILIPSSFINSKSFFLTIIMPVSSDLTPGGLLEISTSFLILSTKSFNCFSSLAT